MWLSFLIPLGVYLYTAAPGTFWEDSAAFQAAAYELGIVHNPSFPVFVMLAHLFTLIPVANPQWLVNACAALFGALSCLMLFNIAGLVLKQREDSKSQLFPAIISLAIALAFAFVYGVWVQSVRAEVYSLNLFITLVLVWLMLRYSAGELSKSQFAVFAGLGLGIGFTNHYLILGAVILPTLVAFIVQQRDSLLNGKILLKGFLFTCLGLLLYVYLPLRESANPVFNWGNFSSVGATLKSILRLDEALPINQMTVVTPFFERLLSTIAELWRSLPLIVWSFAAIGFGSLLTRNREHFSLVTLMTLTSIGVTAYAADFSRYNLDLYGYLMPAYAGIFIAVAAGAFAVWQFAAARIRVEQRALRFAAASALALALFAKAGFLMATNYADASKRDLCVPDEFAQSILESLPTDAIFLAGEDNSFSPLLCKQVIDGWRHDVVVLSAGALLRSDYRKKTQVRFNWLWYPDNWNERSFAEQFPTNLADWISHNSKHHQIAMTLSQWTSPLVDKLQPEDFFYSYSDTAKLAQSVAASSVVFYRDNQLLWQNSPDITTREHFGRLLYNLAFYYSKHNQLALAAKYNRDAAASDPSNVDLLLSCLKMALLTRQPEDQQKFAASIEELDPGNEKLEAILKAALALNQDSQRGN